MFNIINKSELIAKNIEFQISKNKYSKVIPSERKLAETYLVSRNTIREALEILQNKRVISLVSNKYQVNKPKEDLDWLEFFGRKGKQNVNNYIVENFVSEADKKLAQKLEVPLATPVHILVYKRSVNNNEFSKTLSVDYIYAPEKLVKELPLKKLQNHSFWDLLVLSFKGEPTKEYQTLSIESVTFEEASLLGIPVRAKVLQRTSLIFMDETPIYFISKKISENALLMQIDTHFQKEKD